MPVSPARKIAYDVLRRVELGQAFAADLLRPVLASLSQPDQSLATELVLGSLRRRAELDLWIARLSGRAPDALDAEVAVILRLGIYQIRGLHRVPKPAVVNEAVELTKAARKRSAAGLVNAVLRKCQPMDPSNAGIDADSVRLALPEWLGERWTSRFGAEATGALARSSLEAPRTVIRIAGGDVEAVRGQLAAEGIELKAAVYAPRAFVVEGGRITKSPLWRRGCVVIQDEASQLVGSLLGPQPNQRVLDLCAAPGLKTSQIAADLARGLLVACDRSARRLGSMSEVTERLLPASVRCHRVQLDAACPLPFAGKFDRILLDAPCSGTGTLARNPEIKWRLMPADMGRLAEMQRRMLETAFNALAPGGRLVYASCSLEPEENENVVEGVVNTSRGFQVLSRAELVRERVVLDPLFDARGYFRTRPDLHATDGFFAAVIEREV
ncbi:MAG TPA: 16S rRNA (cytosine(967)-C(5))-methyltransferase RsmB [Terriglobia bacterium]|nr:16S rRNA (cytosine(967)-C(5))-methyltransferase RsmB [Terriglobia bacterium]